MTMLAEILDVAQLADEIRDEYVTERRHPEFGELAIYNYSPKCQYENRWNDVTRVTRGLIVNHGTGRVIARAFTKFFNYGDDTNTGTLDLDAPIYGAFDKIDGSLGIQYMTPDGKQAIATRGSFTSEQALHATEWLRRNGLDTMTAGLVTWLWEIVYPENRIVVDYGDRDELVYLGSVSIESGAFLRNQGSDWALPDLNAQRFKARTLRQALEIPPRPNAEGIVVWLDQTTAVKIKQDDYVELHRIVSNLSEKEVWRQLRAGTFGEFAANLPDEFHEWARTTADPLCRRFDEIDAEAVELYREVLRLGLPDRKAQAQWIIANAPVEYRGFVFGHLDGKNPTDGIWKLAEPKGEKPRVSEDE